MERTLPRAASGQVQKFVAQRNRLKSILASLAESIDEADQAAAAAAAASSEALPEANEGSSIQVVIGTSEMAARDPTLIGKITQMINSAYFLGNKELLPPTATTYTRVDDDDVENRLAMGDAGARANRVLHLAFRQGALVGAMSSTFQPGWTPEGCGHWGLLVVAPDAQGSGVASALVAAAERRLAGACQRVQIEYEYTRGHVHSEKLMAMYESKMGFSCSLPMPRRRRRGGNEADESEEPPETQFRKCHKMLPGWLCAQQRPLHLRGLRASFADQLAPFAGASQPGGVDRVGKEYRLGGGLKALSHLRGRRVAVLLFQPADDEEDEDGPPDPPSYIARVIGKSATRGAGPSSDDDDDDERMEEGDDEEEEDDELSGALVQVGADFLLGDEDADEVQPKEEADDDAEGAHAKEAGGDGGKRQAGADGGQTGGLPDASRAELVVGGVVRAVGLSGRVDLNGQRGVIISFDAAKGRYAIQFDGGEAALLKADNLDPGPLGAEPSEVQ